MLFVHCKFNTLHICFNIVYVLSSDLLCFRIYYLNAVFTLQRHVEYEKQQDSHKGYAINIVGFSSL